MSFTATGMKKFQISLSFGDVQFNHPLKAVPKLPKQLYSS